jgi:hypothetical protein
MLHEPASRAIVDHLRHLARCVGAADPTDDLSEAITSGFARPLDDETYGNNALQPGALPIEWSFSETRRNLLRVEFEVTGPSAFASDRQADATRLARNMITRRGGAADLPVFDRACERWRAGPGNLCGAFLGASVGPHGLDEAKLYYQTPEWNVEAMGSRLRDLVGIARASIRGLSPLLCSISWTRNRVAERLYMVGREELRLLDLTECLEAAGLGHRAPDLMITALALAGGRFALPAGTAIFSLREAPDGLEVKLELVASPLPGRQPAIRQDLRALLGQRPESLRAFDRWLAGVAPGQGGAISVASIRIASHTSSRLSVYVRLTATELALAAAGVGVPAA